MRLYLVILFIASTFTAFSQISYGGKPYSFSKIALTAPPVYTTENVNTKPFIAEDAVTDQHKDIPWRFGIIIPCNLNLNNSGSWTTLPNGDRIWKLIITSPNAKSINLNYNNFYLPKGATFFVYNKNSVLGSFNSSNNKINGEFATSLLKGDVVTLEYYEPKSQHRKGKVQVSSIVHGYRDLYNKMKNFGSAGSCHVNAACDSIIWGDEIRSIVMILTAGNSRYCSGALVNNVLQDGTPYVLTADHCGVLSNNIFMFNYQSSDCSTNIDGPTNQTISGCTILANDAAPDFTLVKLSSTPPSNYNVFYAGWSAVDTPSIQSTGIHHPVGDVKKISHDNEQVVSSGYYGAGNLDHWKVLDWNSGTTQGGSSGSPLFNQNHQIVGQLHGGDAGCGNDSPDYYGKFAISWDTESDTLKQLKYWLDPTNTGKKSIGGYDPNGPNLVTDAAILSVIGIPNNVCGDSILPQITIQNKGSDTLISTDLYYSIDGSGPTLYNWTGNLLPYEASSFSLPTFNLASGNHNFVIYTTNPNSTLDQNLSNDTITVNFSINDSPLFATLKLKTDDYGNELSWEIKDTASENIVLTGGGYPSITGGATYTESLCLYEKCFSFTLNDSENDGYCCGFGSGNLLITEDATGDTLAINSTFSGSSITYSFCMGNANGIKEIATNSFNIYPNPNRGIFRIENSTNIERVKIFNLLGEIIYFSDNIHKNNVTVNLNNLEKGIYIISITSDNNQEKTTKIIVE
ncbi:MAG: T9SS type A sorting domain-containing protein [Vicingus serpentipes]|nr:T9SS type A sorting domain-containing protein [Vicingus serpentipes]